MFPFEASFRNYNPTIHTSRDTLNILDMTHAMRQDLARRLDIDISEIAVVRVEEVTWPDAGLGCPDPGFGYAQVLTPGFLAILETGGEEYTYHAANARNFVLCGADGAPVPTPAP